MRCDDKTAAQQQLAARILDLSSKFPRTSLEASDLREAAQMVYTFESSSMQQFRSLLLEMWKFYGRPRKQEFIDAGVSSDKAMDLYERVSAALGDPICAKCGNRLSRHTLIKRHKFTQRKDTPSFSPNFDERNNIR
jgi:hypothetical protein